MNNPTPKVGDTIRILDVETATTVSRAFPDGIDHQAKALVGKEGIVEVIDDIGQLHGTWGGLAINPESDSFAII